MVDGEWQMVAGRVWQVALAAAVVGMVVAVPVVLREPAGKPIPEKTGAMPEPATSVRVEHEIVRVDVEAADADPSAVLPARHVTRSLRQPKPSGALTASPSPLTSPPSAFTKARRSFLGDGRHRPEPFPRVR